MCPVLMVRVDNATPIILKREKSITLGTLGTLALWRSTKLSRGMGELCAGAAGAPANHPPRRVNRLEEVSPGILRISWPSLPASKDISDLAVPCAGNDLDCSQRSSLLAYLANRYLPS
jgi:hypothetical protein